MKFDFYLWVLPFICFCAGYYSIFFMSSDSSLVTPSVVGLSLRDALVTLSAAHLTAVLKTEKEDAHLKEDTVIYQSPQSGQKVKPQQSVFLAITKKPPLVPVPSFVGLSQQEAQSRAKTLGIRLKIVALESHYPQGSCIAQVPQPGEELHEKAMYTYVSSGVTSLRIVPDLRGYPVEEVREFLQQYAIAAKFVGDQPTGNDMVSDQRPLPGSFINLSKKPIFYLSTR